MLNFKLFLTTSMVVVFMSFNLNAININPIPEQQDNYIGSCLDGQTGEYKLECVPWSQGLPCAPFQEGCAGVIVEG